MEWTSVLADLKLFKRSNGRSLPVYSGYRTSFKLEHQAEEVTGEIQLTADVKALEPGQRKQVTIQFQTDQVLVELAQKIRFSFHDAGGEETLGVGEILELAAGN